MELLLPPSWIVSLVLGPSNCFSPSVQSKAKVGKETYCYSYSRPGLSSCSCPDCNSFSRENVQQSKPTDVHLRPSHVAMDVPAAVNVKLDIVQGKRAQVHRTKVSFIIWFYRNNLCFIFIHG